MESVDPLEEFRFLKTLEGSGEIIQYREGDETYRAFIDGVEVKKALAFESGMRAHLHAKFKALVDRIETTKDLTADDEKALADAIEDFKKNGAY